MNSSHKRGVVRGRTPLTERSTEVSRCGLACLLALAAGLANTGVGAEASHPQSQSPVQTPAGIAVASPSLPPETRPGTDSQSFQEPAAPQKQQDQLDKLAARVDRLYRAFGPFLEELEEQAARIEKARQEEKARASNRTIDELITRGRYPEALRLLAEELKTEQGQLGATNAQTLKTLRRLADVSGCVGDWAGCVRHSRTLLEVSGYDVLVARGCAVAALLAGDEPAYREVRARMLAENGTTTDRLTAERAAKVCLLAPSPVSDLGSAQRLADVAIQAQPDNDWYKLVKGMAEFRSQKMEAAMPWLDGLQAHKDPQLGSLAGYFVAMAQHGLNHGEEARAVLAGANARLDALLQQGNLAALSWERWWFDAAASILIRAEAEKLIFGREVSARPTPASLAAARVTWWNTHVRLGCDYRAELLRPAAWKASWSPDNQHLAFAKAGGGIAVVDLSSRQVMDLVQTGKDPAWSPDGKFIAYVTDGSTEYYSEEVWVIPAAGGDPVKIGKGGFPSWSGDSTKVLLHSRELNQILAVRADAPDAPASVFCEKPLSWYPAISPDGSCIAFGAREQLLVVKRETGETIASLATPGERGLLPAWSPDGRQVAFGGFAGSQAGLWIFDVERRGAFQVAKNPGCTMPAWSPDGKRLAFDLRGPTNELWIVEIQSLPREPVLTNQLPARMTSRPPVRGSPVTALVGKPVPGTFKLALLDGGDFLLPDPANTNIVLLDFWASWCGPCRQVMPVLADIAREYADRGVRYVAVNLRESPEIIRRYLADAKLDLTVAQDRDGRMAEAFQVRGIPTMVVVDVKNTVRQVRVGATPEAGPELRRALDDLLRERKTTALPENPK